jgi:PPM family protein phosphatase
MADGDTSKLVVVEAIGRTEVGQVREHNEDSYLMVRLESGSRDVNEIASHELGARGTLLVVCDGMGGAAAGEVASSMAVESFATFMTQEGRIAPPPGVTDDDVTALGRKLREAARDANAQIFKEARQNLARSGMGTTATAVLLQNNHAVIAQVGDSRAYVLRRGNFTQVTRDQSLVNQLLETGHITPDQARFFEHSNVILQALGVQEDVEVQLSRVELRSGDRLMLCSDGLVGVVSDEEIGAVLGSVEDLNDAARMLCELANAAGGPDNITVIVAKVSGAGLLEATDADTIEYKLWKIDPEPETLDVVADAPTEPMTTRPETPTRELRGPFADAPAAPPRNPVAELVSMAVVMGLVLGGVLTGAALYRGRVPCRVEAGAGFAVLADGNETGARTGESALELRLKPGHHAVALRGAGAPATPVELDVVRGEACTFTFAAPPPAEPKR